MAIEVLSAIGASLRMAFFMFWDTLWPLIFGFGLSGAVQAFASRSEMQRVMGNHRPKSLALATIFGAASSSCSYAATAMAKSLFQKGADFTTAIVFMLSSTNLVIELGLVLWILIGWQFAVAEYVGGIIMITLLALVSRFFFRPRLIEIARRRLEKGSEATGYEHHGQPTEQQGRLVDRIRSKAGWADAASYTIADLTMLRRELLIGYVVAGFIAVLVPVQVWNLVFFQGHGLATSIENALVGPLIAILSFVCSVGNVPLAGALWKGGISFGGVISFIFADLITFPLILIYRKFYGGRLTLRLVVGLWLVMAAAGLITEGLFSMFGLVPAGHPAQVVAPHLAWNYTTFLNIGFLAVFGVLYWLHRNRQRLGGGAGYANDPVCGMQVAIAVAPARTTHEGTTFFFCSDRCHDRFMTNPAKFAEDRSETVSQEIAGEGNKGDPRNAMDPVCGMTVEQDSATSTDFQGQRFYFCGSGCRDAFEADPRRYREHVGARLGA